MFFTICKWCTRLIFACLYRLKTYGVKKHFIQGPAIVASNHSSFLDPIALELSVPGCVYHLARSSLFTNPISRWLLMHWACYPVHRKGGNAATFKTALDLFQQKKKLAIYPEGTRSPDGELQPGSIGIGMLAIKSGVPVLPVYIGGTFQAWNRYHKIPHIWQTITVIFGKPLIFDDIRHQNISTKEAYRLATERTMQKIAELKLWYEQGCVGNIP